MFRLSFIIRLVSVFVLSGLILIQDISAQESPVKNIPEFTFLTLNGQPFTRNQLKRNKKLVIVFFDITCDHCQNELKAISEKFDNFKTAEFYLVSMDNVAAIQSFMKKFAPKMIGKVNVTMLRDLNRQFIVRFRPIQFPATYVYGANLKLIKYFGQNSKVTDIISAVNK